MAKAQLIKLLQRGTQNFELEPTGKLDGGVPAKLGQKFVSSESPARKQGFLMTIENNTSSAKKEFYAKTYDSSSA